jgi:N-carbamoylputrescine amidase
MSVGSDRVANLEKAVAMAGLAAERGAKIVAFPQLFSLEWFAYATSKEPFHLAEGLDGPTVTALRDLSERRRVVTVASFFERDNGVHYNTAVVIERDGTVLGRYRKVHLPQIPLWEERSYFEPGNLGFPVFETSCAKIGVQICWDNFFPEGSRVLALKGAELVIAPTASAFGSQSRWQQMIGANAISNHLFVLRVNRVGKERHQSFYGKSFCVNPYGELVGPPAAGRDAILFADLRLDEVKECRETWPFFEDRRPEEYQELIHAHRVRTP